MSDHRRGPSVFYPILLALALVVGLYIGRDLGSNSAGPLSIFQMHRPSASDKIGQALVDSFITPIAVEGLSGGEPFAQAPGFARLAQEAYRRGLSVVTYTGYTWEQLVSSSAPGVRDLLLATDVLIDGPFMQAFADPGLAYRGSLNQRIIRVRNRLEASASLLTRARTCGSCDKWWSGPHRAAGHRRPGPDPSPGRRGLVAVDRADARGCAGGDDGDRRCAQRRADGAAHPRHLRRRAPPPDRRAPAGVGTPGDRPGRRQTKHEIGRHGERRDKKRQSNGGKRIWITKRRKKGFNTLVKGFDENDRERR